MWAPFIISLHPAKFGGHRRCVIEEVLFFFWDVHPRNFVVRESFNIMGEFPLSLVTILQSLVILGDMKVLICHVASRDHMVSGSCDDLGEFSSLLPF